MYIIQHLSKIRCVFYELGNLNKGNYEIDKISDTPYLFEFIFRGINACF